VRLAPHVQRLAFSLFCLATAGLLGWAWWVRGQRYLLAESGVGYVLGIAGGSLMLILLLYPLRKRWKFMRNWFELKQWFRLHMVLGVLGPVFILLHANFRLGSANSTVALVAMLLVAGSGLVGRYLYGKFHHGLYGKQIGLQQVQARLDELYPHLADSAVEADQRRSGLEIQALCCDIVARQQQGVSFRQLIAQRRQLLQLRQRGRRTSRERENTAALEPQYRQLIQQLDVLAGLRLFERLFALWHVVHIPVFLLMVVTALVHVTVVHWY
jgi:hypothetical protein